MKVLVIIPARFGSQRFPGKMLADLEGKSVILRTMEQCQRANSADDVVVATDDERILKEVEGNGGSGILTDPSHRSGTDRCAEALEKSKEGWDLVIDVQGDEPFIQPQQIDQLAGLFEDPDVKIGTLASRIQEKTDIQNPSRVKVVFDRQGDSLYFSRSPIPYERVEEENIHHQHIGIYAFRSEVLPELARLSPTPLEKAEGLEQLRWMENGYRIRIAASEGHPPGIDTPEDLERVRNLIRSGTMDIGTRSR